MKGMLAAPSLPIPEVNPKPRDRIRVPNSSVVIGYNIWKHIFIERRQREEISTIDSKPNNKWRRELQAKNRIKLFFLPKLGLSIRKKDIMTHGTSPATVSA